MFVTYETKHPTKHERVRVGTTVSILGQVYNSLDMWYVGAYNINGKFDEWVACGSELNGFNQEDHLI